MKKTRRFVALLLAAVLALALFTACGAAEQPQSAPDGRRRRLRGFSRDKNSVENHRLCPFSTPGFSPRRFVENCPG